MTTDFRHEYFCSFHQSETEKQESLTGVTLWSSLLCCLHVTGTPGEPVLTVITLAWVTSKGEYFAYNCGPEAGFLRNSLYIPIDKC